MQTYVHSYMKQSLVDHILEPGNHADVLMVKPGTNIYSVYISEVANRLCITGDICLGSNDYGIVSAAGYKLAWFAGKLSESYLCEKFLRQVWQWDAAVEEINSAIEFCDEGWWIEHADKLKQFISSPGWRYDEPTVEEFYEFMTGLGDDGCDLCGYDYPRIQAGWLCSIQQRYSELRRKMRN